MATLSEDAQRVVEEQRLAFVATVNDDGTPNLSPKGTIAVLDDSHVAFCNIRSPRTIYNLKRRRNIEVNIVDPIGRKGYRLRGTATVIEAGEPYTELVAFYRDRGMDFDVDGVVVIRVLEAEPLISPAYDQGLTEPEVRERWRAHFAALEAARQPRSSPTSIAEA